MPIPTQCTKNSSYIYTDSAFQPIPPQSYDKAVSQNFDRFGQYLPQLCLTQLPLYSSLQLDDSRNTVPSALWTYEGSHKSSDL